VGTRYDDQPPEHWAGPASLDPTPVWKQYLLVVLLLLGALAIIGVAAALALAPQLATPPALVPGDRLVLAREMVARRSSVRPSRASALGLGSLARLGLRPEAFHKTAASVRAPVLVVHARDDHHVPVDFALSAARRHPAWTVKVIDAGGHNAHVDRPDAWLAATETWLSELTI